MHRVRSARENYNDPHEHPVTASASSDSVPPLRDLITATVVALRQLDGHASVHQLRDQVVRDLRIPPDVAQISHAATRASELDYRLAWARTRLRSYGVIERVGHGTWALTPAGRAAGVIDGRAVLREADRRKRAAREARERVVGDEPSLTRRESVRE